MHRRLWLLLLLLLRQLRRGRLRSRLLSLLCARAHLRLDFLERQRAALRRRAGARRGGRGSSGHARKHLHRWNARWREALLAWRARLLVSGHLGLLLGRSCGSTARAHLSFYLFERTRSWTSCLLLLLLLQRRLGRLLLLLLLLVQWS